MPPDFTTTVNSKEKQVEQDTPQPQEMHERANPIPWFMPWRKHKPTALVLATEALEQCRKDRLHHAHANEFHAAQLAALTKRESRLESEVLRLSRSKKKSNEELPSVD